MFCKIYADNGYKRYFKKSVRHQYMRETHIECYANGIIVNEHRHGFGVFDKNFKFVKNSRQVRRWDGQFVPKFNHKNIPYMDYDVIFVGNVYSQFGHFLLEHMNRAYAILDKKYKDMKVVLINNKDENPVPKYMFELLELMGVKRENILILNETMQFRNVYVPVQGFNIPVYSSNMFGKIYDAIAKSVGVGEKYEKVYLSRCALKDRRTRGEERVQKIFEKNGFKVICPETLSLCEQIAYIKNAKVLAGCAGTALHWALLMKPGGTVIQLKRNRIKKCNANTQYLINKTKGLNSVFISASVEAVKTDHGSNAPQIIGVNKYLKQFFDDNGFKYSDADIEFDKDAWDEYMNALKSYKSQHGDFFVILLKRKLVRFSACLIPGRENRARWRHWLKGKLHL